MSYGTEKVRNTMKHLLAKELRGMSTWRGGASIGRPPSTYSECTDMVTSEIAQIVVGVDFRSANIGIFWDSSVENRWRCVQSDSIHLPLPSSMLKRAFRSESLAV